MIDLRAARNDPDAFRAALARKGAAEAFDALLAADERWRALVPRVDELRGKTKLKGKPTPEQLEELQQREGGAAGGRGGARRGRGRARRAARAGAEPAARVRRPTATTEEDAVEISPLGRAAALAEAREHTEIGRFDMERAARVSGSRFGYRIGDTALLALALYRFALDRLGAARLHVPCCRRCSSARRRCTAPASSRPSARTSTRSRTTTST